MYDVIIKALEDVGVATDFNIQDLNREEFDINLQEYITESILFITFIIKIEETLGIELPDDILLYESISSIKAFACNLIEAIQE